MIDVVLLQAKAKNRANPRQEKLAALWVKGKQLSLRNLGSTINEFNAIVHDAYLLSKEIYSSEIAPVRQEFQTLGVEVRALGQEAWQEGIKLIEQTRAGRTTAQVGSNFDDLPNQEEEIVTRRPQLDRSRSYAQQAMSLRILAHESWLMWQELRNGVASVRNSTIEQTMSVVDFGRYAVGYWSPYWKSVFVIVPSLVAFKLYQTAFAVSLGTIVNSMVAMTSGSSVLIVLGTLAISFPLVAGFYIFGQRLVSLVSADILNDMRFKMFAHLQALSINFYKRNTTGNIISRFSSDIDQIEKGLTRKAIDALIAGIAITVNVGMLFVLDWHLGIVTVLTLPAVLLLLKDMTPWAKATTYRLQKEKAKVVNVVQENFTTQAVVKGYGYQQPMLRIFQSQLDELRAINVESLFSNSLVESTSVISLLFSQLIVTCVGGFFAFQGFLLPGTLVAYLSLMAVLHKELYDVAKRIFPNIISSIGTVRRIEDLLSEQPQVTDAPDAITMPPILGEIRFENVSFSYTGEHNHLSQLSLTIPAKRYIAVVGASGAGKSTFLNLLLRFYDVNGGRILVDGYDVRQVTQESLRSQVGIVFQEPLLFNTTIGDNIRMSKPNASDAEIEAAAKAAEIHDFIASLPDGYNTLVGERGGRLSGGQQQRVSIARAILRHPAILMLDEATSALDLETEAAIAATIESLASGRTVIFVTHRLRTIVNADSIYVLDRGTLAESGSHHELLARTGIYHRLWHAQGTGE